VIFACGAGQLASIMAKADELLRANVTVTGTARDDVYYPARDHVLFCDEAAIFRGDLRAWRLPERIKGYHRAPLGPAWVCAPCADRAARWERGT
jgi:hypothetical protein